MVCDEILFFDVGYEGPSGLETLYEYYLYIFQQ